MPDKEENKIRIEFAKELNNASLLLSIGVKNPNTKEQEKVLRIFKVSDFEIDIKVNDIISKEETRERIFFSGKHICELVFYHNESIDAVIHRLEELKKM